MSAGRRPRHTMTRAIGAAVFSVAAVALTSVAGTANAAIPEVPDDETYKSCAEVPTPAAATIIDVDDPDTPNNPVEPTDELTGDPDDRPIIITRTWDFSDGEATQKITVDDTTPPEATAPLDVTVVGAANVLAAASLEFTDDCDGAITDEVPTDDPELDETNDQVITRTWEVADKADNSGTAEQIITVIPEGADLEITAEAVPNPVTAGDELAPLVYTITVANLERPDLISPDTATGVTVEVEPIEGTNTIDFDDAITDGCEDDPSGAASCTLPDIDPGDEVSYTVTVDVPSDATGTLTHTWAVFSDIDDPDLENNTFKTDVDISSEAAMSVTAKAVVTEASNDPTTTTAALAGSALAAGDPVDITITVDNGGPSDATNAELTATFTTNIDNLEVVDNDGPYACDITSRVLSCTRASHPVDEPVDIVVSGALTGSSTVIFQDGITVRADNSDDSSTRTIDVTVLTPETTPTTTLATTTTVADTTTTITATTTTIAATTTTSTTTTTTVAATPTTTATGALPSTGTGNQIPLLASLVALLAGIAALTIARRKPEFATAALNRVGISRHDASGAAQPVRRINSNGVSTEIEEPRRGTERP